MVENRPKRLIGIFQIKHFPNFCPINTDLSGNTVWQQALDFQTLAKHFDDILSARNVE